MMIDAAPRFPAAQTDPGMNPRKVFGLWQQVAHRKNRPYSPFAIQQNLGDPWDAPGFLPQGFSFGQDCYPFPSPWSGPTLAGPFLTKPDGAFGHSCAICVMRCFFWFDFLRTAVESGIITTNNRGRKTSCGKSFFLWRFFQPLLRAVCKTRHRAALLALRRVQHLPILPTTVRLPVRLLVGWRGLRHAASTSACRLAIDLNRLSAAVAADTANTSLTRSTGANPRLAVFSFSAACRSFDHV